jgi:DNA ligase (NAD+)
VSTLPARRNWEHFVSRGTMDLVGMGIKIVEQLVAASLLHDVADIYSLKKEDLLELEGFADKKAENIIQSIQASKGQSLERVITAMGIRGVGEVVARDLASAFRDLEALSLATIDDLQEIEGIGPNIAQAITDWFNRDRNKLVLKKLKQHGVWPAGRPDDRDEKPPQTLEGLTFVVTGTMAGFSRDEIKAYIESKGGKVTGSVSNRTDYLVVGENPGTKLDKAQELNIFVLDEYELLKLGG